jgi:hypothetical protein
LQISKFLRFYFVETTPNKPDLRTASLAGALELVESVAERVFANVSINHQKYKKFEHNSFAFKIIRQFLFLFIPNSKPLLFGGVLAFSETGPHQFPRAGKRRAPTAAGTASATKRRHNPGIGLFVCFGMKNVSKIKAISSLVFLKLYF